MTEAANRSAYASTSTVAPAVVVVVVVMMAEEENIFQPDRVRVRQKERINADSSWALI